MQFQDFRVILFITIIIFSSSVNPLSPYQNKPWRSPNVSIVNGGVHGHQAMVFFLAVNSYGRLWGSSRTDTERCHNSMRVYTCGKCCFPQKLLTGELSTAHGYPRASPTKRDNTPFKKTARSEAVVAEVPAGRSGRERRHTPSGGSPLSGAQPPSLHRFFQDHNIHFHVSRCCAVCFA